MCDGELLLRLKSSTMEMETSTKLVSNWENQVTKQATRRRAEKFKKGDQVAGAEHGYKKMDYKGHH